MMNYYVYLALARGKSDALLRQAEDARRAEHARRYGQRARAADASRSPRRRLPSWEAAEIPPRTVGYPPG